MARKPTLTQAQLDELRAAYEAWSPFDPDSISADELARQHGISKNTMYTWRQRGWLLNGRERSGQTGWVTRNDRAPADQTFAVREQPDKAPKSVDEIATALRTLKALCDDGILTEDEWESKRKELIGQL